MATSNFSFRLSSEGGAQVIGTLQELAKTSADAEAALRTLTQASPQLASVVDGVEVKLRNTSTALKEVAASADVATKAHGSFGGAANKSSLAAYDLVKALAEVGSGMPITMVATQHAGQAMYLYGDQIAAAKSSVLAFASSLTGMATIAGGAAVLALGALGYSAESNARQLNALQNTLRATRDDYASMAQEAQAAARAVAGHYGISSSDATGAAQAIAGAPEFQGTQQQLESLVKTSKDLATVLGITVPKAAQELAAAMEDPGAEADKLAKQHFPGMSEALAYSIKQMAASGDKAGAFAEVLGVVQRDTAGVNDNLTPLQQSLRDLSETFTRTGQDGKSLGQSLGTAVTNGAAAAVRAIATLVGGLETLREMAARGGVNTNPIAGVTGAGDFAGTSGNVLTSSAGALGIFQLMPGTAAALHVNPNDAQQNIYGGLSYIQQLYQQHNGSIPALLAQYGGYGSNVAGAAGYISSVNSANTSVLNGQNVTIGGQTMTVAQAIAFWGQTLGMPPDLIALGQRIAVVESGGHQFASPSASAYAQSATGPSLAALLGGAAGGIDSSSIANVGQVNESLINNAWGVYLAQGTLSKQIADNRTAQSAVQAGINAATQQGNIDDVKHLTEALDQLKLKEADLITPQEKLAQAAKDSIAALSAQSGYERSMADVVAKFTQVTKDGTVAVDERALAIAKAAEQVKLATNYSDAIHATDDATAAQKRITAAYDGTTESLIHAQNYEKAYAQALLDFDKNSPDFAQHVQDYADALNRSSDAAQALQQAQSSVQAVTGGISSTFDTLGQSISNAFVGGSGAAVNFGNILRSLEGSLASLFIKLGVINPLLNSIGLGSSLPSLWTALGVLGNGGGSGSAGGSVDILGNSTAGGGIFGNVGSLLNIGKLTDGFGLTNFGSTFSNAASSVGSFFGLGGGGIAPATSWDAGAGAFTGWDSVAGSGGGLGGILGPLGLDAAAFSLGSMGGGWIQSAMGKVGPGPMIGAGLGAILGGPIGAIIGGLGGGLIGPKKASAYSQTDIGLNNGLLTVGASSSQIDASNLQQTTKDVATLNATLQALGVTISSLGKIWQVGQNTPGGFQDPSKAADISSAISNFRFASNDNTLNAYLSGKSFSSLTDLQTAVTNYETLINTTIPALNSLTQATGSYQQSIDSINQQFGAAITAAQQYGVATDNLAASQQKATQQVLDQIMQAMDQADSGYMAGYLSAKAIVTGSPQDALTAQLFAFDASAQQQRDALTQQLVGWWGDSIKGTEAFNAHMAALDKSLNEQRLAIQTQYNNQLAATAESAVSGISSWLTNFWQGASSPLNDNQKLSLAAQQFNTDSAAAQTGDLTAIQALTGDANAYLSAGRSVYGSGTGYVAIANAVTSAMGNVASLPTDMLTGGVFKSEMRSATQQLSDGLAAVVKAVNDVRAQMKLTPLPGRIAA